MSNSIIRLQALVYPADYFDPFFGQDTILIKKWKIYTKKTKFKEFNSDKKVAQMTFLMLEKKLENDNYASYHSELYLEAEQVVKVTISCCYLASNKYEPVDLDWEIWEPQILRNGIPHNITPFFVDLSLNAMINLFAKESYPQSDINNKTKIKEDFKRYMRLANNDYYMRVLEHFLIFHKEDKISAVYDMQDVIKTYFKEQIENKKIKKDHVYKLLNIPSTDWNKFGSILNCQNIEGGRHLGKHNTPTKAISITDKTFIEDFAKTMLDNFIHYIDEHE